MNYLRLARHRSDLRLSRTSLKIHQWLKQLMSMLGAICGSAISMDLPAQSMDPYSAQKSMDICAIYGLCVGCKSFHYSNPSLAQTYYIDRLATSTNLYNRRNRITDCRRRNSVKHSVAACSCRKITIIRHVRFVPG